MGNRCKALILFLAPTKRLACGWVSRVVRRDEEATLEAGKPGANTEFIQLHNKNHLFLTIVSVEVCAYQLLKLWKPRVVWGEKGIKKNNALKTQQICSQSIYLFGLVGFCLAFVYLVKTEVGVFYLSSSNTSGSSRFEAGGEERKRARAQGNLDVFLCSGKQRCSWQGHDGSNRDRAEARLAKGPRAMPGGGNMEGTSPSALWEKVRFCRNLAKSLSSSFALQMESEASVETEGRSVYCPTSSMIGPCHTSSHLIFSAISSSPVLQGRKPGVRSRWEVADLPGGSEGLDGNCLLTEALPGCAGIFFRSHEGWFSSLWVDGTESNNIYHLPPNGRESSHFHKKDTWYWMW